MQHKGEIIAKAVRDSGFSITKLADRMGKSRRWVYQVFEKRNVSTDYILEIGKIIHHDFTDEIKELKQYKQSLMKSNWEEGDMVGYSEEDKAEYWKNKYLLLLEKYNDLLTKKD